MKNYTAFILENKSPDIDKKLIDQYGKIKVYSVNGEKVRDINKSDEEFGLASVHGCFPKLVPENEIWIEDDVKKDEIPFLVHSALYQIKLTEDGMGPWDAYRKGVNYEKNLRDEKKNSKKNPETTDNKANKDVYVKKWGKAGESTVWLVDAEKVRDLYKTDFLEGGNGYVYPWVPNDEIWIENGVKSHEIPFIILHEYVEKTYMKEKKMKYDDAHSIAAKAEWNHRPDKFTKKDAENLTPEKALEMGNG